VIVCDSLGGPIRNFVAGDGRYFRRGAIIRQFSYGYGYLKSRRTTSPAEFITPALLILFLLIATACGGEDPIDEGPVPVLQAHGQIIDVVARTLIEIESFTIRDEFGQEFTFTTEGFVEFTPSHLKEHQFFGQAVLVTYVDQEGGLLAVEIGD